MHVKFIPCRSGPPRLLCEAELYFDENGPLAGLHLVGFSLWRNADGTIFLSCPARAFEVGYERRFFNYVRGDDAAAVERFKAFILDAFTTFQDQGGLSAATAARQHNKRRHTPGR